jgi:hypothetical protein
MAGSEPNRRVFVDFQPMSPEDMQRTMQFLLHQQAQFAADSARFEAFLEKLGVRVDQVTGAVVGLTSNLEKLGVRVDQMTGAVVGFTGAAHRRDEPAGDLPSRILERIP